MKYHVLFSSKTSTCKLFFTYIRNRVISLLISLKTFLQFNHRYNRKNLSDNDNPQAIPVEISLTIHSKMVQNWKF